MNLEEYPQLFFVAVTTALIIAFFSWWKKPKVNPMEMKLPSERPQNAIITLDALNEVKLHQLVLSSKKNTSHLVLVLPGNPGIPGFYEPFMRYIHDFSKETVEVCCLCHTGHSTFGLQNNNSLYDLTDQIKHKIMYIKERLEKNPNLKISIIGHSIGSHITLALVKEFPHHVARIALLQPAIMHIAQTPNGKKMMPIFQHYQFISKLWKCLGFLPIQVVKKIIALVVGRDTHVSLHEAALSLTSYQVVANILYMALHEMNEVLDIDRSNLQQHEHNMLFVYANNDKWCPNDFADELKKSFQKASHVTATPPHAFMLDPLGSFHMATQVWNWIKDVQLN